MKIKVYASHDRTVLIYIIATINYPQINGVHMRIVLMNEWISSSFVYLYHLFDDEQQNELIRCDILTRVFI